MTAEEKKRNNFVMSLLAIGGTMPSHIDNKKFIDETGKLAIEEYNEHFNELDAELKEARELLKQWSKANELGSYRSKTLIDTDNFLNKEDKKEQKCVFCGDTAMVGKTHCEKCACLRKF